ncbi:hypothetical protein C7S15_6749 [Burkholderia cepacia]|nr:hypothetical protein [Burkholderia cepacia]
MSPSPLSSPCGRPRDARRARWTAFLAAGRCVSIRRGRGHTSFSKCAVKAGWVLT